MTDQDIDNIPVQESESIHHLSEPVHASETIEPKTFKVKIDVDANFASLDDAMDHFNKFPTGGDDTHLISVVDHNGDTIISKAWNFIKTRK